MGLLKTLGNIGSGLSSVLNPLSAGMSIVGTLGGLFGANEDRKSQERINEQNIQMQRETNANQMQMARDANKLQENMMYANMAWQQEQADRQWQRETEWNDIGAQMKRAAAAGVNPFVALGKGNVGNIAGQMSTPGASSAGISPAVPNLTAPRAEMIQGKWSRTAEILSMFSQSMANLSQSRKTDAETKRTKVLLNEELRSFLLENDAQELENSLNQMFALNERSQKYKNLIQDYNESVQRVLTDISKMHLNNEEANLAGKKAIWEDFLGRANELLINAKTALTNKQYEQLQIIVRNQQKMIDKQLALQDSEINKNNATAEDARSHVHVNETQADLNDANRFETDERSQYAGANAEADVQEKRSRTYKNYREADKPKTLVEGVMEVPDKLAREKQGRTSKDYDTKPVRKQYRGSKSPGVLKRKKR